MSFDDVLGQEQPKQLVRAALDGGRLGHSYLFSGPDGVGKTLLAVEAAKALFCRGPAPRPCDNCPDCHMVDHDRHPDLLLVEAQDSRVIRIEQVCGKREDREIGGLIRFLTLRPVQAAHRVVIVREAERMNDEAANAFLKTLEEPEEFALLILTTARPRSLLPTIRSRCQEVRFAPLLPEQVLKVLSARPEFVDEDVPTAARFASGSAGRAMQILESGSIALYRQVLERLLALPKGDAFDLADDVLDWAAAVPGKLEAHRERVRDFLRLIQYAYRDLLLLRVDGDAADVADVKGADLLRRAAPRFSPLRLLRIEEALWTARRQTDANAALDLVLQELFGRIAGLQGAAG